MRTLESRLWSRVVPGNGCCIVWTGLTTYNGYGRIRVGGKGTPMMRVHRAAYELRVGPIPEGLQIDHLCRNRRCVNPAHLEAVTQTVNILRGESPAAKQKRRTHCIHGHEFERVAEKGQRRRCRICQRQYKSAYEAKVAAASAPENPSGKSGGRDG